MSCNCNGPLELVKMFTVRGLTITPAVVTLTVNRLFADLPQNSPFRLCISRGILPRNNTGVLLIADPAGITLEVRGWQGNLLRNDSLTKYVCNHACGCGPVTLSAYKGNDPAHVTIFNKMCASSALTAEVAPPEASPFSVESASLAVKSTKNKDAAA